MVGVAFPRPFSIVSDLEQIKLRQASSSCSTSSSSAFTSVGAVRPGSRRGTGRRREGLSSGLSFLEQQDLSGFFREHSSEGNMDGLVCLMRDVGGGFWQAADGEGQSNSQYVSKKKKKKEPSLLLSLVREIQPLDVSHISREVSPDSTDAMKRTISGMLGLLPSDQFKVSVETSREPLAKLLVSSMMTGYTLRNAEYRLCLQRSLDCSEANDEEKGHHRETICGKEHQKGEQSILGFSADQKMGGPSIDEDMGAGGQQLIVDDIDGIEFSGHLSEELKGYIQYLKQKLEAVSKELEERIRISTGLQMQNIVGEEKNDLLDYLRGLAPDKVAELSQPTSPDVEDVIQQVISDILDNSLTRLQCKSAQFGNGTNSTIHGTWQDGSQKLSTSSLQSQSVIVVNRDYLARLLFWCMLMGHHMRGLEYRLELSRTLSLSGDLEAGSSEKQ